MKFVWWPHTSNPAVASYRLRCVRIVDWLQNNGFDAGIYRPGIKPETLVLSKRYDRKTVETAKMLREEHGTRLVIDLCDNHFYADSASSFWEKRAAGLRIAINAADLVVVSTDQLAAIVASETEKTNIVIIGDAVEQPYRPTGISLAWHPLAELHLLALRTQMNKDVIPKGHRLVWYGNHGSGNAEGGMTDLARLREFLENCHKNYSISLTVISNHRAKFEQTTASWKLPTYYLDWNFATFSRALQLHDVAVIPVTINPFTICKTNNRIATAILHGLGVVADSIPSYQSLADYIELNNWEEGIVRLIENTVHKAKLVALGTEIINQDWSLEKISKEWLEALDS